jgi:ribosomal protein S18 acetylase RimI-like enzyme
VTTVLPELVIERYDADGMRRLRAELLAVYAEVYVDRLSDPFFSEESYWKLLEGYASRDGFRLVTGRVGDDLVGYALGYALPAGSGWWRGLRTPVDPGLLIENGRRTFGITYMMVREAWRRRGYARALHDALLADRVEERATLLVRPENAPARNAYLSWGWWRLGELQPFDDAPVYDAMMLELKEQTAE